MAFSIKLIGDLCLRQTARQFADSVDLRGRISKTVCSFRRELHQEIGASATLPADVNGELSLFDQFVDRNIFDEEPQHSFAVLGLCAGCMPQTREIPRQREHFRFLLRCKDTRLFSLKFSSLLLQILQMK